MFWNKVMGSKKKLKYLENQVLSLYVAFIMQLPHERFIQRAESMYDKNVIYLIEEMRLLLHECFEDKYMNRTKGYSYQDDYSDERIAELEAKLQQKQLYIEALSLENSKLKTTIEVMGDYCENLLEEKNESV